MKKYVDIKRLPSLVGIILALVPFLLLLIPILYTENSGNIVVINGYQALSFLNDSLNKNLYYGTISIILLMVCLGIFIIYSFSALFVKEERLKTTRYISYFFYFLALASIIASIVLYSYCIENSIHLNIGIFVVLSYLVVSMIIYIVTSVLIKKKKQ